MRQLDKVRAAIFTSLGLLPLACAGKATLLDTDRAQPFEETGPDETKKPPSDHDQVLPIDNNVEPDDPVLNPPSPRIDPVTIQAACSTEAPFMAEELPAPIGEHSPVLTGGIDTGLRLCGNGILHRPEPVQCPSFLPRPMPLADAGVDAAGASPLPDHITPGGAQLAGSQVVALYGDAAQWLSGYGSPNWWQNVWSVECTSDAECTEAPFGYCAPVFRGGPGPYDVACKYGCVSDSDCGAGQLCECGDPVGRCVDAQCRSDAECGGFGCAVWFGPFTCAMGQHYSCRTSADECVTGADCESGTCTGSGGTRRCLTEPGAVCGRPFLVAGAARTATLEPGSAWCSDVGSLDGSAAALPGSAGPRVAEHWARAALMEHASIAAFARFTLELMHLGAPLQLIEQSQQAMLDETQHAKLCFAQAARFLSSAVQPGPLPMQDALRDIDLASVTLTTFLEGCVGETVAALEALEARSVAADVEVEQVLDEIARDELRHAELAFRFVQWALSREPGTLARLLERELSRLEAELQATSVGTAPAPHDPILTKFGVLPASARASLRRAAIADIILPCARALLAQVRDTTACDTAAQSREPALTRRRADSLAAASPPGARHEG